MSTLTAVRRNLLAVAELLGIGASDPPAGASLPGATEALLRSLRRAFPNGHASAAAQCLADAAMALPLVHRPGEELLVLRHLHEVTTALRQDVSPLPEGQDYWLLARTSEAHLAVLALTKSGSHPGLAAWVGNLALAEWQRHAFQTDAQPGPFPSGADLLAASTDRLARCGQDPAGQLAALLIRLPFQVEARMRLAWMDLRATPTSSMVDFYRYAWDDLLPLPSNVPRRHSLQGLLLLCRTHSLRLDLPVADPYVTDPESVAKYALAFLLPPDPSAWRCRTIDGIHRLLDGQMSRWHDQLFHAPLTPLQMVTAVLRTGRPLRYERVVSHSLLQYSIILSLPAAGDVPALYVDTLRSLRSHFDRVVDGLLLQLLWRDRQAGTPDWVEYLDALTCLHFSDARPAALLDYRRRWLHAQGLQAPSDVLTFLEGDVTRLQ